MLKKLSVLTMLCVVTVFAANVRPVTINTPPGSEQSLQQILNLVYGTGLVNAASDQSSAFAWQLPGPPEQSSAPMIKAVNADAGNAIGVYTNPAQPVLIFTTASVAGTSALITFEKNGTLTIIGSDCAKVNCGNFSGVNQYDFGFVLETQNDGGHTYYTDDSLNPSSTARAIAYQYAPTDRWAIAFEDGTDFDYNDKVMSIESITAVPEPAAVVLFGAVLVLCVSGLRRRRLS